MRFTLRDLLWLTLLVASWCGWYLTYRVAVMAEAERAATVEAWGKMISDDPFGGKASVTPTGQDPFAPP